MVSMEKLSLEMLKFAELELEKERLPPAENVVKL